MQNMAKQHKTQGSHTPKQDSRMPKQHAQTPHWWQRLHPATWLLIYCAVAAVVSIINCEDVWVWVFEIYVGIIGVLIAFFTRKRFPLSNVLYVVIGLHFTVLATGAHYTYAKMPLFDWLKDVLHLSRNHFDRVGHFMQGFCPALVTREILVRKSKLAIGKMLAFLSVAVPLALSALWEILEMLFVVLIYKNQGMEWLGIQGDIWDSHWDMTLCLIGAIAAIILLSRWHTRSMAKAEARKQA
jgi:putative membrane protein